MKGFCVILLLLSAILCEGQIKSVHVFVALCDNEYQGIVPVPSFLGNGKDPARNLYWGAAFGLKSYFRNKTTDWELVENLEAENPMILESVLFKHKSENIYMFAQAYDGEQIQTCIEDFLKASNNQNPIEIEFDSQKLKFGGASDLVAYIGHDGLMDFNVEIEYQPEVLSNKEVIILACYSKNYFAPELNKSKAHPLLWTTHLMAPEAYTLKAALDGWKQNESGLQIEERAAQVYNKYQKCGINGARNLFASGF